MFDKTQEIQRLVQYLANRRTRLVLARDRSGDRLDPGDVPRDAKTCSAAQWLEHEDTFQRDAGPAVADPAEYFPVVDRFRISTPVKGFFYANVNCDIVGPA